LIRRSGFAHKDNERLAAQRQIAAALGRLHKTELEAAIALATAAEGLLPDAEGRRVSAYPQEHKLGKQVDIDKTIDWLKRGAPPDAATIFELEAAVVNARVMSEFADAYGDAPLRVVRLLIVRSPCKGIGRRSRR